MTRNTSVAPTFSHNLVLHFACTIQNLRYHTQDLLRQKVSSHYQLFMRGTEDIQHVEQVSHRPSRGRHKEVKLQKSTHRWGLGMIKIW